jgi:inosine-uridine nucleoside N-ribohydrolase
MDLVKRKVNFYCMMAGAFGPEPGGEYNVVEDLEAARETFAKWPTPIVASGFEIGIAITYPATSIEQDYNYVKNHPIAEAYKAYMKMPYDRPCWDLTAVLYAIRPDRGYFGLSQPGTITLDSAKVTRFAESSFGKHRFITVTPEQITRVREACIWMASSPPRR